jgi:hypothetical protein
METNFYSSTPTIVYFIALYVLVIIVRLIKVTYAHFTQEKNGDNIKFSFKPVFFVSLEMVYTAVGFVLTAITFIKDWNGAILIIYAIIIIISMFLDAIQDKMYVPGKDDKKYKTRSFVLLAGHLTIIAVIVVTTIWFYGKDVIKKTTEQNKKNEIPYVYQVNIPYFDQTLNQYLGINKFNKRLLAIYIIKTNKLDSAINIAKGKFINDSTLKPFYPSFVKKNSIKSDYIIMDENNIVAEKRIDPEIRLE